MFPQIHMRNRLLLHWEYESVLVIYQSLHVDPMPTSMPMSFTLSLEIHVLEWAKSQ